MDAEKDIDRDARLNEVLLDYVEAIERGESRDQAAILAAHPDLADDLARFFVDRRLVERMAGSLRAAVAVERLAGAPGSVWGEATEGGVVRQGAGELGRIGDFRLLREVGRGGMGVVYEAEQHSLRRRVALKVLPFAATFDSRQLQRFRNEAQAAAQLHHTAIVPVYAVGVESGVHYYAMQFIEGQSLAELIEGLRRSNRTIERGSDADSSLTPTSDLGESKALSATVDYPVQGGYGEQRRIVEPSAVALDSLRTISTERYARGRRFYERVAGLGVQAAEGLEHAHQVGVVHRDVKPANLLLDAQGDLWVTDFGLALFRSDSGPTMTGELVGTLRFMSPEQATAGKERVDHRTDIYSLGITLYELATLTPAFDGRERHEILRRIVLEEPKSPRAVDPAVPIDLETIILKAIAKDPADRYATAREMADDLRRFVKDRPILARRPTLPEVAGRWVRRHRVLASLSVAVMAAAVVGLSVFASILAREHAATQRALEGQRRLTREADELRAAAEANFLSARKAVDVFVELSDEELLDFPPIMDVRRRLLEASVAYYRDLAEKRPGDPSLRRELASSQARLAQLMDDLASLPTLFACLLLTDRSVQKELELRADQASSVSAVIEPISQWFFQPDPEGSESDWTRRWKSIDGAARTARQSLASVLTPRQLHRLDQIVLQHPGPHSFINPETIQALGLTEAQQVQVREIQVESRRKGLSLLGPTNDHRKSWLRQFELWTTAYEKILALFTPAQKAQWSKMTGAPFRTETPIHPPLPQDQPSKSR